jgi:hypothetical protein
MNKTDSARPANQHPPTGQHHPASRPHLGHGWALALACSAPVFLLTACIGPHPLRGGHAQTSGPVAQTLAQGDNPSAPTRQTQDTVRTRTYTLAPSQSQIPTASLQPAHLAQPQRPPAPPLQNSTPLVLLTEREESHATTELGAAQKDTAREAAAKLASLKPITLVGLAMFVFGLVSLFWLPLKTIIGSTTTSAAIAAGGLALIVLPTLLVGNELLIIGGVSLGVGAWFLAHRHGHLRGQLAAANSQRPSPTPALHLSTRQTTQR